MKIKLFLSFLFIFLVACGAKTEEPTPTPVATQAAETNANQTTLLVALYNWQEGLYDSMIEAFEAENPDIKIQIVNIEKVLDIDPFSGGAWPDDAYVRLASAADVVITGADRGSVAQGVVLDLTALMNQDENFDTADFFPGLLEQYQWDGGTWSLPTTANYNLIFYNKDTFDAAGIAYPQPGWTWDDFLATAQALTLREGDEVTQWGFVESTPIYNQVVEDKAGALLNPDSQPPTTRLDDSAVLEAVQWYADLFLRHEVALYNPSNAGGDEIPRNFQLIEGGEVAMWTDFSGAWEFRSQQGNIGVVPFPVSGPDSKTSPAFADGISVSAGTQKVAAAWKWITFLTRQSPNNRDGNFFVGLAGLPARRSVAEATQFWDGLDAEFVAALQYAIEHAYTSQFYEWGNGPFNEAMDAILSGEQSVADALAEAQDAAEVAIQESLAAAEAATPVAVTVAEPEVEIVAPGTTRITFVTSFGPFASQAMEDLVTQFEQAHPEIQVELEQPSPFSGFNTFSDMAANADCFQSIPAFDSAETLTAVLPLEPFFDNDPTLTPDDFFPAILSQFAYQGQVVGLPAHISVSVVEYNKDLFDAAGLEYPAAGWTTEDFLETAVALTSGEGDAKQYGYVPDFFEPNDMINMIERAGAVLIDDSVAPPTTRFDDSAVIEAVRWYTSLTTEFAVKPTYITNIGEPGGIDPMGRQTLIDGGRAGMWTSTGMGGGMMVVAINSEQEEEDRPEPRIGVAPLPVAPDGDVIGGYQSVEGYFISAQTGARQACWEWIKFLTEQPNAGGQNTLPAHIETAESQAYRQSVGDERADAFLASIQGAIQPSFFQRFSDDNSWLGISFVWLAKAYDQILNGEFTVDEAMIAAQETVDTYRNCIIAQEAFEDPSQQQACLQEADPSLPDFFFQAAPANN